ncbi:type II toxin-antitoxin system VapC family toxin [Mucilaginibacter sp. cycad4]|uniref:type II toxin-antitoxin system VapC family toxin n=1 Tax=Mucilaginibacter sp. cycad4 TaxID=3342096 RepID=UPI002AAB68E8|nr:type II toxin-antitoxin system VapC family toxin [Mucilaginibacter gossypii]WPV02423.1 type II toxin-antitoxin system VapC family toxin [Mucilaginibacter gossypii]
MEQGYLIDTNAIIDYLDGKLPEKSNQLLDEIKFQISVISRIELLAWRKATEQQLKILNDFINISSVFDMSETVILKSIDIRKIYKLKLPDAIIAATALANNLILVTRNINDFKAIANLHLLDPYSL